MKKVKFLNTILYLILMCTLLFTGCDTKPTTMVTPAPTPTPITLPILTPSPTPIETPTPTPTELTSVEIGRLLDAVVYIEVTSYNGSISTGSGFYVDKEGILITNFHVIYGAKTIEITEQDGTIYNGNIKVIGYDVEQDIAVLDIERTPTLILAVGDSKKLLVGEIIYAIGSPLGLKNTLSSGIVSSLRNQTIQITAPISPGSSGGALLNGKGEVVGITTSKYMDGENLGVAIPISIYTNLYKDLDLDLAELYALTFNVQKPENVLLKQTGAGTVTIYWDEIEDADYYHVYASYNEGSTFTLLHDTSNDSQWYWYFYGCIEFAGFEPGEHLSIKVAAVKDDTESPLSDIASITIVQIKMSFTEFGYYLWDNYPQLSVEGKEVDYYDVYVTSGYDDSSVEVYLDMHDYDLFKEMDRISVEVRLSEIALATANYYDMQAIVILNYTNFYDYDKYPSDFELNNITGTMSSIQYMDDSVSWYVYYPCVKIIQSPNTTTFGTQWAN